MKKIIFSLSLLLAQPVFGLLPPLSQSINEMREILLSQRLTMALPVSQKILSLTATEGGYLVMTQDYQLFVEVRYLPQTMPGPARFQLIFHDPVKNEHYQQDGKS